MGVHWRQSAGELVRILRRHGVDPGAVTDAEAAWRAFREFLQIEIEGLAPDPEADPDGFIVQWGRCSWDGARLSASFTRQLAVIDGCGCGDLHEQADLWQVDLALVFDDAPGLMLLDGGYESDMGFYFEPVGPLREAAVAEAEQYAQLQAVLQAIPVRSELSFECVC